jgi:hypothetical protein
LISFDFICVIEPCFDARTGGRQCLQVAGMAGTVKSALLRIKVLRFRALRWCLEKIVHCANLTGVRFWTSFCADARKL